MGNTPSLNKRMIDMTSETITEQSMRSIVKCEVRADTTQTVLLSNLTMIAENNELNIDQNADMVVDFSCVNKSTTSMELAQTIMTNFKNIVAQEAPDFGILSGKQENIDDITNVNKLRNEINMDTITEAAATMVMNQLVSINDSRLIAVKTNKVFIKQSLSMKVLAQITAEAIKNSKTLQDLTVEIENSTSQKTKSTIVGVADVIGGTITGVAKTIGGVFETMTKSTAGVIMIMMIVIGVILFALLMAAPRLIGALSSAGMITPQTADNMKKKLPGKKKKHKSQMTVYSPAPSLPTQPQSSTPKPESQSDEKKSNNSTEKSENIQKCNKCMKILSTTTPPIIADINSVDESDARSKFRSWSRTNHPDKNKDGDNSKFQDVSSCVDDIVKDHVCALD